MQPGANGEKPISARHFVDAIQSTPKSVGDPSAYGTEPDGAAHHGHTIEVTTLQ